MAALILSVLLVTFIIFYPFPGTSLSAERESKISVFGVVFCDACSTNTFSSKSYFLPGVHVRVRCRFKESSKSTQEQILLSVETVTDARGIYKLDIPGINGGGESSTTAGGLEIVLSCQASLVRSPSSLTCNSPATSSSVEGISVKSDLKTLWFYGLNPLTCRPHERNDTLCENPHEDKSPQISHDLPLFFLRYCLFYYGIPFPKTPFPSFPPLPHFSFPPFPFLPPFPPLPPLPFRPWPQLPPLLFPQLQPPPMFPLAPPLPPVTPSVSFPPPSSSPSPPFLLPPQQPATSSP